MVINQEVFVRNHGLKKQQLIMLISEFHKTLQNINNHVHEILLTYLKQLKMTC